ncbi:MAG: diacylglycerol kinase family protein [Pseudomonadales bacterium]
MQDSESFSLASRLRSFSYAISGLLKLVSTEHNAWIHAVATISVFGLAWQCGITRFEWMVLLLAVAMVWVAEALNTAVEYLANAVSLEFNPHIKHAKDIAAGAVLLAALFAAALGSLVFYPYLFG